jgi:hypothetical protein
MNWIRLNTGQVKLQQGLGQYIRKYAADSRFSRYLEIGTWNGGGSTVCFAAGFESRTDDGFILKSFEVNHEMYEKAAGIWSNNKHIELIHGHILRTIPTLEEAMAIHPSMVSEWHTADIKNIESSTFTDVSDFNPEVVCLDGGEYITYFEYKQLKSSANVFMLDDISVAKCSLIVKELTADPEWRTVANIPTERNGWAVFERVNAPKS